MNKIENSEIKSEKLENEINEVKEEEEENKKSKPILKNGPQGVSESTALLMILGLFFVFMIIANYVYIIEHTAKNNDLSKASINGENRVLKLVSDRGVIIDSNKINIKVLKNLQKNGIIEEDKYEMRHVFGGMIRMMKKKKIKKII